MAELIDIKLTIEAIELEAARFKMTNPEVGGECHFVGTVRNSRAGREVTHLFFEAYQAMAVKELRKIAEEAHARYTVEGILIHHRLGKVEVGGIAVLIIATAIHRDAAFAACQFAIDQLKATVPIWKKEVMIDGEVWVSAHP